MHIDHRLPLECQKHIAQIDDHSNFPFLEYDNQIKQLIHQLPQLGLLKLLPLEYNILQRVIEVLRVHLSDLVLHTDAFLCNRIKHTCLLIDFDYGYNQVMPALLDPIDDPLELMVALILDDVVALGLHDEGAFLVPEDVHVAELFVLELLDEGEPMGNVLV